jgi:hypothetical protein
MIQEVPGQTLSNCREAVRLAPDTASTWSNLGNVLKDLKYIQWGFR